MFKTTTSKQLLKTLLLQFILALIIISNPIKVYCQKNTKKQNNNFNTTINRPQSNIIIDARDAKGVNVNINTTQQRHITDKEQLAELNKILKKIPSKDSIVSVCPPPDKTEAIVFAKEILQHLHKLGYTRLMYQPEYNYFSFGNGEGLPSGIMYLAPFGDNDTTYYKIIITPLH